MRSLLYCLPLWFPEGVKGFVPKAGFVPSPCTTRKDSHAGGEQVHVCSPVLLVKVDTEGPVISLGPAKAFMLSKLPSISFSSWGSLPGP